MAWSRFYGTVKGKSASEAGRLGDEDSGLTVEACSTAGRITVRLQVTHSGKDKFWISMHRHGQSEGWEGDIAVGDMGVQPETVGVLPVPTIESFSDEALVAEVKRRFDYQLLPRQPEPSREGHSVATTKRPGV